MATAKMTLIGLENYLNSQNKSLFDNLVLPTGIEKDVLLDSILLKSAEFEVLYPDAEYMYLIVPVWGRKWYRTFDKWITALNIKYDPLYNYDRTEEWTSTDAGSETTTRNLTDTEERDSTNAFSRDRSSSQSGTVDSTSDSTTTNQISAYNSSAFENDNKSITDAAEHSVSDAAGAEAENLTGVDSESISKKGSGTLQLDKDNTNIRTGRAYGNIGVTTSQQMLESELDIAAWNIYDHIADIFLTDFVIPVY